MARANLAYLYALQDRPARALELHQRNLTDYERVLGPDHLHTVNARANLASSYRALGDLARAIALHQQSVADYTRVFGPAHSETITARSNLAYAYQLAGDYAQAIPLYRQVLADRERLYGPGHRYTELGRRAAGTRVPADEGPGRPPAELDVIGLKANGDFVRASQPLGCSQRPIPRTGLRETRETR